MTDVFFSYSSKDRERVRPIRDALVAEGFDVFWDQEVPPGRNWDEWIRQHLDAARCAIVFWSETSVKSDNVMHEATVAKSFNKLIPVLLDPLESGQFPMGHYTTQGVIIPPEGISPASLQRLSAEVEAKAVRRWMRRKLAVLEGQVASLTSIREHLEDEEASLHKRLAGLEGNIEVARREKAQLKAALAVAQDKLHATQSEALGASSEAQEQALLRLTNELAQERKAVYELRAQLARLKSSPATEPLTRQGKASTVESIGTSEWRHTRKLYVVTIISYTITYIVHFIYVLYETHYQRLYAIEPSGTDAESRYLRLWNSYYDGRIIVTVILAICSLSFIAIQLHKNRALYLPRKVSIFVLMSICMSLLVGLQFAFCEVSIKSSSAERVSVLLGTLLAFVLLTFFTKRILSRGMRRPQVVPAS